MNSSESIFLMKRFSNIYQIGAVRYISTGQCRVWYIGCVSCVLDWSPP